MTTWFHNFNNLMRTHIFNDVIILAGRIGRNYVIVNQFFSANSSKKLPHSIASVLQSRIFRWVRWYISKNSSKRPVFSGCWHWEVFYPKKNQFFNFCHGKKNRNTVQLPPPKPKQQKMLQKVTKIICWWSLI